MRQIVPGERAGSPRAVRGACRDCCVDYEVERHQLCPGRCSDSPTVRDRADVCQPSEWQARRSISLAGVPALVSSLRL
jgi:hypothetical protein